MKKRKLMLITAVSFLVAAAVIAAALNLVFTITKIETMFTIVSDEGEAESYALQEDLEAAYLGKSTTFLDLESVQTVVAEYPCFELISTEKNYPNTLLLQIGEREELFAFRRENGMYAVLSDEGLYLSDKETNVSREGGENILLSGFTIKTSSAGAAASGTYLDEILILSSVFQEEFEDARANVKSITLQTHYAEGDYFHIEMREGVCIDIYTPGNLTREKMLAALAKYVSLTQTQKLYGYFDIMDLSGGGEFTVSEHYSAYPDGT